MWHGGHECIHACTMLKMIHANNEETSCGMDCTVSELHRVQGTFVEGYFAWFSSKLRLYCLLALLCIHYANKKMQSGSLVDGDQ